MEKTTGGVLIGFLGLVPVVPASFGAAAEFDFKDPKGVNSIAFILDSTLEPIMGVASGVSGTVSFDPAQPKSTAGTITVEASSLHIANKGMKDSLQGTDWLDAKKHPQIEFKVKAVKAAKKEGDNTWELQVVGDFTCKGVTKTITVPVKAHYLKDKMSSRSQKKEGDLLVLRSKFNIKRKDFNIKADMGNDVVAEEIQLHVSIVGGSPKK